MNKLRAGIEIPIIPEDFIDLEEEAQEYVLESPHPLINRDLPGGIASRDWDSIVAIMNPRSRRH
jgi:hypothetical protein